MGPLAADVGNAEPAMQASKMCIRCDAGMVPSEIQTRFQVRSRNGSAWDTTPLETWSCRSCGKTELFARDPDVLS